MIKKNLKTMIITSIIILAPIIAGVILWDKLPDQIATHFSSNGTPDGWSPKEFAVFGMPIFLLVVHWCCIAFTSVDPKKQNISDKVIILMMWLCPIISILGCGSTYLYELNHGFNSVPIAIGFVGCLFLVMGNYMPKMKQSYIIGIKIPWTLNSEENWNRTHRLAGRVFMLAGAITIIAGFLQMFTFVIISLFVAALIPTLYSFVLYKKGI